MKASATIDIWVAGTFCQIREPREFHPLSIADLGRKEAQLGRETEAQAEGDVFQSIEPKKVPHFMCSDRKLTKSARSPQSGTEIIWLTKI